MQSDRLKYGCQTFTWEMLGKMWGGSADDILKAISSAGYSGIEITDNMIGDYAGQPKMFAQALQHHNLELVAFAFGSSSGFTMREALAEDLATAEHWIEFAKYFPGALISIGSATVVSDRSREENFFVAAEFYNEAALLGAAAGVDVAIHPSSHENTLLFTRTDYDQLFGLLDNRVGWVPDTGHILRGHEDLLDTLQAYKDRVRYIHLKDVKGNGDWAMLGDGICDIPSVVNIANTAERFNGWLVVEEESEQAAVDPESAIKSNLQYLALMGFST